MAGGGGEGEDCGGYARRLWRLCEEKSKSMVGTLRVRQKWPFLALSWSGRAPVGTGGLVYMYRKSIPMSPNIYTRPPVPTGALPDQEKAKKQPFLSDPKGADHTLAFLLLLRA